MQLAVEARFPEVQELREHGIFRRHVEFLPDEALQDSRMVRHVVENFRGRQTIAAQRQFELAHLCFPSTPNHALSFL